jgi:hypothetical protein
MGDHVCAKQTVAVFFSYANCCRNVVCLEAGLRQTNGDGLVECAVLLREEGRSF